jgi:hypothetical protein
MVEKFQQQLNPDVPKAFPEESGTSSIKGPQDAQHPCTKGLLGAGMINQHLHQPHMKNNIQECKIRQQP